MRASKEELLRDMAMSSLSWSLRASKHSPPCCQDFAPHDPERLGFRIFEDLHFYSQTLSSTTLSRFTDSKMEDIVSSRIFIKGLPPTLNDAEFRKHFSQNGREITDAKIFPNRRIGYIGYKTPEDAQKAVKYFNRTFMRMSRIGVEIARPAKTGSQQHSGNAPTARRPSEGRLAETGVKRKRESKTVDEDDPKLKEFMDVMRPKSKKKTWETEAVAQAVQAQDDTDKTAVAPEADDSDEEYEVVPMKSERAKSEPQPAQTPVEVPDKTMEDAGALEAEQDPDAHEETDVTRPAASDADWARSRTSRLLGLLDDDEEEPQREQAVDRSDSEHEGIEKAAPKVSAPAPESSMPTPPSETVVHEDEPKKTVNADVEAVRSNMRLFVRNLSYDVKEEDLETEFVSYGALEEVRLLRVFPLPLA